jgi:hypothetical protein
MMFVEDAITLVYFAMLPCCSLDDANDPSVKWLKTLEASFVWEARSLCFVAVAVPLFFIYPPAKYAIGGLAALVAIVMVRTRFFLSFFFTP